ncbi:MAG: hypothetical protein R3E53_08670 [Myxococcota bacterium]
MSQTGRHSRTCSHSGWHAADGRLRAFQARAGLPEALLRHSGLAA